MTAGKHSAQPSRYSLTPREADKLASVTASRSTPRGVCRNAWSLSRVLLMPLALMVAATPAFGQYEGVLTIKAEDICSMFDQTVGMRTIRVIQRLNPGSVASRFKVVIDPGVTMTYVSETYDPTISVVGNARDGITLCYGSCRVGDVLLVSMNYLAFGTSASCSQFRIVPHPDSHTVEAIRCDNEPVGTYVQDLYVVGPGGGCGCPSGHVFLGSPQTFGCGPVPARTTTWGAIKAFYVN